MPSSKNYVRDYKQEYEIESIKRRRQRAERNAARRLVVKRKGKKAVQGKDVGHKLALSRGGANVAANLFLQSSRTNRSFSRRSDGSMKSERSRHGE